MQENIKKILYVSYSILPSKNANSVHVCKMSQAFQRNGADCKLVGIKPSFFSKLSVKEIYDFYALDSNLEIKTYPRLRGLKDYDYKTYISKEVKKINPDLIYTRSIMLCKELVSGEKPVILELHSRVLDIEMIDIKKIIMSINLKLIVVISQSLKNEISKQLTGFKCPKIIVQHDGVDLKPFMIRDMGKELFRKKLKLENKITAGYVGHLYEGKGIELILDIAKRLPQVNFIIVGGKDEDILKYKNKILKCELGNVRLLGFVANSKVAHFMKACDFLLMPYQRCVNGSGSKTNIAEWMSPLKMFEYMASNRPIVSSSLPVLMEVLNNENSVLCDPDNLDEWIDNIKKLISSEDMMREISLNAMNDVKKYSWECRANNILKNMTS